MKLTRLLAYTLVLFCVTVIACSDGFPPEFPAADFTLKSPMTETAVSLSTIKGKPAVLYWFTSG